jgi:regulator of replication initiation timing
MMKKIFFILLIFQTNLTFAQSKKVQIEQLKVDVDSLKIVLENESNSNFKKVQELNSAIGNFENQISSLKSEVKDVLYKLNDALYNLNQNKLENTLLKNDLNLNLTEISSLKIQLKNQNDSLKIIFNELHKIKTATQNTNSNIPENNYDLLVPQFKNKEKNITEYKKWIANILSMDNFNDTPFMTEKCWDFVVDVCDYRLGYDGSIEEETLIKKWANQYDLKYSTFGHLFESGNCGWGTQKLTKVEFLGELNNGDWFKLTIKGGCGINDFSTTLIRVIKVIKKENAFYIDNFISLSKE